MDKLFVLKLIRHHSSSVFPRLFYLNACTYVYIILMCGCVEHPILSIIKYQR
jgi:hypothetical protein